MASAFQNCRSVMVTGASRGLGLQIVESLAKSCHCPGKVIATAREPSRAKELRCLVEKYPNIHIVTLDVVNQESIANAAKEVEALVGEEGLSCLINNAGINVVANLEKVTAEQMMQNFETNSVAPLMITKAALNMVTRCLAVDLEADGILCTAIHPGWVRTDMGGAEAPLSTEESISSVLSVIGNLSEKDHGGFLRYTAETLPW
ncbi:C-signal-like isoform X2 [Lepisosteus oculatus]|uniref:C-signal-like isoform X2 n=1 Tax=Lepisosteus oculatus TaxID=7918 RepID=UPI0035F5236F